jgi:hypothetical protein
MIIIIILKRTATSVPLQDKNQFYDLNQVAPWTVFLDNKYIPLKLKEHYLKHIYGNSYHAHKLRPRVYCVV